MPTRISHLELVNQTTHRAHTWRQYFVSHERGEASALCLRDTRPPTTLAGYRLLALKPSAEISGYLRFTSTLYLGRTRLNRDESEHRLWNDSFPEGFAHAYRARG